MFIHSPNELDRHATLAATGQRIREHNAAVLLRTVWDHERGISRADLARALGLSPSTVSAITTELLADDLIVEDRMVRARSGRPPILLRFRDDRFVIIGVEIGGSHLSCVRTDMRGSLEHHASERFDVPENPDETLRRVEALVESALEGVDGLRRQVGIGVAVPSPLDTDAPGRLSARILPAWDGVDVGRRLYERFGMPVLMDNDANLGALAEAWWGAGRGLSNFTYVKVATGVGAGHIINGEIFRGSTGIAGEIGHCAVTSKGRLCRCGLHGCLEAESSSHAILAKAEEALAEAGAQSGLSADGLTIDRLVAAAHSGDPLATEVIADAGHHLGIAMANLVSLLNPARVILGGHITMAGDLLVRPVRRAMAERALQSNLEGTEVRVTELRPGAIARGAATLVLRWALDNAHVLVGPGPSRSTSDMGWPKASTRLLSSQPTLR
ncbi:MAG: ROK family transcriptional regulator [Myxococcota bacterium]